jgi:ankyrin repeat protein
MERQLLIATQEGDFQSIEKLLSRGVDPNVENNHGYTPLHYAVVYGFLEIVKLLLKNRADPNVENNHGYTPLHYAAYYGRLEIVKILLSQGVNSNVKNVYKQTPLHFAISHTYWDIVKIFLYYGVDDQYFLDQFDALSKAYPEDEEELLSCLEIAEKCLAIEKLKILSRAKLGTLTCLKILTNLLPRIRLTDLYEIIALVKNGE